MRRCSWQLLQWHHLCVLVVLTIDYYPTQLPSLCHHLANDSASIIVSPFSWTSSHHQCCWSAHPSHQQPSSMLLIHSPPAATNVILQPLPPRVWPTLHPSMLLTANSRQCSCWSTLPATNTCQWYCWSAHPGNKQTDNTSTGPSSHLQPHAWHCKISPSRVKPTLHPAMLPSTSSFQRHCWSAEICCFQHDTTALTSKGEAHSGPDEATPIAPIQYLCNNGLYLGPPPIQLLLVHLLSSQTPGFPSPFTTIKHN